MPERIWRLSASGSERTLASGDGSTPFAPTITCPIDPEHPNYVTSDPLRVIFRTRVAPTIAWTWLGEWLVQDRVLQSLRNAGLIGLEAVPAFARVKTAARSTQPPTSVSESNDTGMNWSRIKVTGWGGMAAPASGIKLTKFCLGCGWMKYSGCNDWSRVFDESQWDGSDFFMIWPMPVHVFVTERAAAVLRTIEGADISLTPIDELQPNDGFTPGRLGCWMSEELARTRGTPHGIYAHPDEYRG